jgi:hypothetical protein
MEMLYNVLNVFIAITITNMFATLTSIRAHS